MDWIKVAIEEYKTLRNESIESIKAQQTTLNIGTIIIGGLVIVGFNLWDKEILPDLIFLFFTPVLCYLILTIWMGEVKRMSRAGNYIKQIEIKISKEYPKEHLPLNFENWLRNSTKHNQLKWNYIAVISLFLFISLSSILIGNYKVWNIVKMNYLIGINILESAAFTVLTLYVYVTSKNLNK